MFRILKICLVATIGVHALLYALQNIANFQVVVDLMAYVMGNADHDAYPDTLFIAINVPALHLFAAVVVIAGETAVGLFGIKGAWDMFRARNESAEAFHAAKQCGLWAAGLALLVWFGFFMTIGATFFQMWQTPIGQGSMEGAFMYAVASAVTMLFVYLTED